MAHERGRMAIAMPRIMRGMVIKKTIMVGANLSGPAYRSFLSFCAAVLLT
jgi:hypothetical protein